MTPDQAPAPALSALRPPSLLKRYREKFKRFLSKLLVEIIMGLNRADLKLTGYYYQEKSTIYQDLGPTAFASKNEVYEESLLSGLKNKNVNNLAITGPYGSGKSSVIATFQRKHKEFCFLNVSLATFAEDVDKTTDWRQKIELSILQQLIYHVKNEKLPDSRFKKIDHTTRTERVFVTFGLVLLGFCVFYIYKPAYFAGFSWWKALEQGRKDIFTYCALGYFLLAVSVLVYRLYRTIKTFRFSKIGLTNGEIELAEKDDKSIFNKHLDEIIYFFQVTRYDVIVIEDLDRFDDPEIFTKLREVNNLINNSLQVGRRIVFLYAVRDDMFKDKDRAKFFDFIIPVIPVINTSNAGDELRDKLGNLDLEKPISDKFLNTITFYIQDMRLLINIINEFRIYLKQIGKGLDAEKLLAIIVYKNLYPEEFAKLHNQAGEVYDIINVKRPYIAKSLVLKDAELGKEQEQIATLMGNHLSNIRELRSVYIAAILEKFPGPAIIRIDGVDKQIKELLTDVGFNNLMPLTQIRGRYFYGYSYGDHIIEKSFKAIEKEVNPDYSYTQRYYQLQGIYNGEITKSRERIALINKSKAEIHGYTIAEIISNEPDFEIPEKLAGNQLLTFLITEGFIDEHYPTYISFFIEGSLSLNDMDFVNAVAQKRLLPIDHDLKNIQTIITKWLNINNFSNRSILNIKFVDYLISQTHLKAEIDRLFGQLDYVSQYERTFILTYLSKGKEKDDFMRLLCEHWSGTWAFLHDDLSIDPRDLDTYLLLILKNVAITDIKRLNSSGKLAPYLARKSDFLTFISPLNNPSAINEIVGALEIVFDRLENRQVSPSIFDYIYHNDHYQISLENIETIFQAYPEKFEGFFKEDLLTENFTVITNSSASELDQYIEANLENYVDDVILSNEFNTNESAESLTTLLQYEGLPDYLKLQLIKQQQNKIDALSPVPKTLYTALITGNKIESNWGNLMEYFIFTSMINEAMTGFINDEDNLVELTKEDWDSFFEDEQVDETVKEDAKKLQRLLLTCEGLSQAAYEQMVDDSYYIYDDLDFSKLSSKKVKYLIASPIFEFTKENIETIISKFPDLAVTYLVKHHEPYFKLETPPILNEKQYLEVLERPDPGVIIKVKLLELLAPWQFAGMPKLISPAAKFLLGNNTIGQPKASFVKQFIAVVPDFSLKMELIQCFDPILSPESVCELLKGFPKPFPELSEIQKSPVFFKKNDRDYSFLKYLENKLKTIISTVTPDEKKKRIRVNFRRSA